MPKVLIADAIKPSLVMSSEIFKDKIPGAEIFVAATGEQALQIMELQKPDICLVDFDLPDVDGPSLVLALRKIFMGPILMTAFPDNQVTAAVSEELFAYNDASAWLSKPIKFDELADRIDKFLIDHHRTGRRFPIKLPMQLIAKAEGRGKRAPKSKGHVLNLSLGGAMVKLDGSLKVKKKQEITVSIAFPGSTPAKTPTTKGRSGASTEKKAPKGAETKIKGTIAWTAKGGHVGVQFSKLTDLQLRGLETFLKAESIIPT
jgi:CheY-like chemotaxis protein